MHEIEPTSFCSLKEYQRHIEKRKQAAEISVGGLYLILAALRKGSTGKEAIKFPIRAKIIDLGELSVSTLTVDILDADLQPSDEARFTMENGIAKRPNIAEGSTNKMVREMYVRDYEDYVPIGPGEETVGRGQGIEQLELIGV